MTTRDPSANAFRSSEEAIRAVASAALPGVANALLFRVKNAATYHERGQLAFAQIHILETQELFLSSFATFLNQGIEEAVAGRDAAPTGKDAKDTDWQSLGLVDDGQIEESIGSKRIGQLISHASEPELRELDGYTGAVLGLDWADQKRNPLRGDVIGTALHRAIEKITEEPVTQKILSREFAQAMAEAMPACYREIIDALKKRQVKPVDLALRPADDHSARRPPGGETKAGFDDLKRAWEASWVGRNPPPDALRSWEASIHGRFAKVDPLPSGVDVASAAALLDRLMRGVAAGMPDPLARSPAHSLADAQLTDLLRRLSLHAIERGEFETTHREGLDSDFDVLNALPGTRPGPFSGANRGVGGGAADELTGLMAINLIRAHREELEAASRSRLDHLVIEVVSSLFDQILSDSRVPPQMARQIARLQLPVLRVALVDPRFFSSRRHPVRRFINRIASLACAFDEFDGGPGAGLVARVGALVGEIVQGDFDQLDVYEAKLDALQRFVDDETHALVRDSAAAPTLRDKEIEWRVQRRFAERLAAALEPCALPAFVRDFLCGVWTQAIVVASRRDGEAAEHPRRLRRVAADLVASLQPKRTVEERKRFVSSLPALMRELTEGMAYAGFPQADREAFFGQLVALHMGSLKAPPSTDLDHNMRLRQIDAAARTPLPRVDANGALVDEQADAAVAPPVLVDVVVEPQFSAEEKQTLGLVSDATVDWSSTVDPAPAKGDTGAPLAAAPVPRSAATVGGAGALPTIDAAALHPTSDASPARAPASPAAADSPPAEPELAAGLGLRDHLQLGFSYQLNLKGRWERIRLTYMSPGRTLFLFSHGAKGRETVSMTTRTLSRLCEAGRLRAYETAYLVERSTERARQRLAGAEPPRAAA